MSVHFTPQAITLLVLVAVVAALIWDKLRADVVALAGAAVLLITGVLRPIQVQSAFAAPAIVALASLFVIAYAMELSGLLDISIRGLVALCRRVGRAGLWVVIAVAGGASAFLNNTPIVVLTAPVVREAAKSLGLSPKRFLMPLSYSAVLGGCCTLIGTSTNLLVNDMAGVAGLPKFGLFDITPVGLVVALSGGLYLLLFSGRLIRADPQRESASGPAAEAAIQEGYEGLAATQVGSPTAFVPTRRFQPVKAIASLSIFASVIMMAALNVAPIAACAFAGAVLLILLRIITADEAYSGLRPDVLMLIAGMVVLGIAMEVTGVAEVGTRWLIASLDGMSPLTALIVIYGATLFATELLSNATVAVLFTPVAVALAEALHANPQPFLVAVMIAGSAAFATPFGYQTNALVYQMGGYNYLDFVRVGLPLNLITWITAVVTIPIFFPL
ncbi:SLC13/DASS family transporter [Sphingomonas piscis]|uniref:SLC13/DASS family transporter n=1 Tax=Sphingomonas piscis TaxID=2714943 RepID=A0A6G7YML1_9SPHN|nr:SLC13 family permease [Sphingomonas piscis]QIK77985.1 SLC13/DASS family transporter [Sphingomonas piscis]